MKEARWRAESAALRRSVADAEQQRLRESTVQWQAQAAALAQPVDQPVRQCRPADAVVCHPRMRPHGMPASDAHPPRLPC